MFQIPVLSSADARRWDQAAVAAGTAMGTLMENAGRGVAALLTRRFAAGCRLGVLVAAGPGNNGGDGWVVARALEAMGLPVWVVSAAQPGSDLPRLQAQLARQAGVREVEPDGPWPTVGLVVDAMLGTGTVGRPRPNVASLMSRIAEMPVPVVAVDGPTGLDLDTGASHEPVRATLTVTFGGYHRGHLLARDEVGDLVVLDIGLGPPMDELPRLLRAREAARAAPPLAASGHKGVRGRVVIVGGDTGMIGAARLAARAAFAAGAGLVYVVAPPESLAILAGAEPDLQTVPSTFEALSAAARQVLAQADAVVVGPGLGRAPSRIQLVAEVAAATRAPLVVDADGLMAFAGAAPELGRLAADRAMVITPHAGEYRALFPEEASRLGTDPWGAAVAAAESLGATVLLKGVPTVVAPPWGPPITVAAGNPGLATGGSGDTLTGIIAAWLGQGVDTCLAAAAAAQALGEASDLAARRFTARAVRPMDVTAALPDVWRHWDLLRREAAPAEAPILHELPAPIRL